MWQIKTNFLPFESITSNDIVVYQVVKKNLRPDHYFLEKLNMKHLINNRNQYNSEYKSPIKINTNRKNVQKNLFNGNKISQRLYSSENPTPTSSDEAKEFFFNNFDLSFDENSIFAYPDKFITFSTINSNNTATELYFSNFILNFDQSVEDNYNKLYEMCWKLNSKSRPSSKKILKILSNWKKNFFK